MLANPEARNQAIAELYRKFGLTNRQIDIIADAVPKRHYYYVSPLGRRLFELSVEAATLSFIGAGSKEEILAARRLMSEYGEQWPCEWLKQRGLEEWSNYCLSLFRESRAATHGMVRSHREEDLPTWSSASLR